MNNINSNLSFLDRERTYIEAYCAKHLPDETTPPTRLHSAMRYAVLGGGKRIRPLLALGAYRALGGTNIADVLPVACALELVHSYSLVHDDLPCMDDDDMRRGQPSCHTQFDVPTALLAGDALLTLAFEWCTHACPATPTKSVEIINTLARAVGSTGMCGGQQIDMESPAPDADTLTFIHTHKTADLITASLLCGANVADITETTRSLLTQLGNSLGIAFQYIDDLLDAHATAEQIGKTPGKDAEKNKLTAIALLGNEGTRIRTQELLDSADNILTQLPGDTDTLQIINSRIRKRFQKACE